ncbi:MAG: hypothetical protein ABI693_07305 [Bryobacteraceae bacterium]
MTATANSNQYTPVLPLHVEWSSVLSQDVITAATILVDSTSPAPVAVFTNPSNAKAEALAIVNTGSGSQLCHVARDRTSGGGWRSTPLFGGKSAQQVAAGIPYAGTPNSAVYGLFLDDQQLYVTTLAADGATWSAPATVANGAMTNPRVAYSPDGRAVIYGGSPSGDLVTVYQQQIGGPFTAVVCKMQGALTQGDFQLCLTDEESYTILSNYNAKPYLVTGVLGNTEYSSFDLAPGFTEKLTNVALGYWSPVQQTLIFLLVDDDKALHAWSQNSNTARAEKIPNASIAQAAGHVADDGSLNVYAVDSKLGLWALHQSKRKPWNDDGTPRWAPVLQLDKGVSRLASDMNPAAAPSLFALDGGDSSLRLHAQDAKSRLWKSDAVHQHKAEAFEVARYRSEVSVVDKNGRALSGYTVHVAAEKGSSTIDAWSGDRFHEIDETGVTLTTDHLGKLTVSILANDKGLACPNLIVTGALNHTGLIQAVTVKPSSPVHTYLSGKGTLHPTNPGGALSPFDANGETLKTARVPGPNGLPDKVLAPKATAVVAQGIRQGALVALKEKQEGVVGFGGSLRQGSQSFEIFYSEAAMQAHREAAGLAQVEGFWEELLDFFGDIWEGICNAVIAIAHFVVEVAREVVHFVLEVAEGIAKALDLPVDGIEKAAAFMNGVFNSADADIDKVVAWLKALFDFKAIWNTKKAFEQGVLAVPDYVKQLALATQHRADDWFSKQKLDVNKIFADIKKQYAGQTLGQQPNWQNPAGPVSSKPVAGDAATSDFTGNPHHNWLWDKTTSYAPQEQHALSLVSDDGPWEAFAKHMAESGTEFVGALGKFKDAMWTMIVHPEQFATVVIPDLIDMVNLLIDALLDLCDAMVDAAVGLAVAAMDMLKEALGAELQWGMLNTLWAWMAKAAGHPEDTKLTFCALGSLLAAFPTTIIFKLIVGVEHEPFPGGVFPAKPHAHGQVGATGGLIMSWDSTVASDSLRMFQVLQAGAADIYGNHSPKWLTGLGVIWSIVVWVCRNGYPGFSVVEWASFTAAASQLLWIGPLAYFSIKAAGYLKDPDILGDKLDIGISVLGGLMFTAGIGLDIFTKQRRGQQIANLLTPMPALFAFLNMSQFRNNPEEAPFAIGGNLLADFVGYVGGGLELLLDTLQTAHFTATA